MQLINKPTNGETCSELTKRKAFVYQIKEKLIIVQYHVFIDSRKKYNLLFYQSNDGGRIFSNNAFLYLIVPNFFSRALLLSFYINTTIFNSHKKKK